MKKIALLAGLLACTFLGNAQQVTTFAGSISGYVDGTLATAQFSFPTGTVFDAAGNMYVTDISNNCIRKISTNGMVSTFAGSTQGFVDGTGTAAQFNFPMGIAIDASGNLYVTDLGNNSIRKITPAGVVSTIAGATVGYADGTGTAAQFNQPFGITVDASGNLFVADFGNNSIRKITPSGVVTTIAGATQGSADGVGTAAQFYSPQGIAIDASGNLYVTDSGNYKIRKITPDATVSTLAGSTNGYANGTGSAAKFSGPGGITVDNNGNIYVTDAGDSSQSYNTIRKITAAGVVTTLAGSTQGYVDAIGTAAQFNDPYGVAIDASGNLFVSDSGNNMIRKITLQTLGVNGFLANTTFTAYPNPFGDLLKIQSINQDLYSYKLYDVTGKPVLAGNCNDATSSAINTSALAKGVYVLSLTSDEKIQNIKVVKQ